jgi:hypothetical protein
MNCFLCRRDTGVVESHIIPEFLYQTLYDSKHRFHHISLVPSERNRYIQKGLREKLLCEACEQRLSVSEHYMSRLLNGGVPAKVHQGGDYIHLSELDYKKLKLFQLSILWRAGVSSLPAFSQVKLGSHEPRIRAMLLSEDPGAAADYGCIMSALMNGNEIQTGIFVTPTWVRIDGQMAYRFVFGGLIYVFVVSSTIPAKAVVDAFAQPEGTAFVLLTQMSEMKYLIKTLTELRKQGKFSNF